MKKTNKMSLLMVQMRKRIPNDMYYEFTRKLQAHFEYIRARYYFLDLTYEKLSNLYVDAISEGLEKYKYANRKEEKIIRNIEAKIRKQISKRLKRPKDRLATIEGLLVVLKQDRLNSYDLLHTFTKELDGLSFQIDEKLYAQLVKVSQSFRILLIDLGLLDFSFKEYTEFLKGKYDGYFKVKAPFQSLKETIEEANYFVSLRGKDAIKLAENQLDKSDTDRVRTLIAEKEKLTGIKRLYCDIIRPTSEEQLDWVFATLSAIQLERLLQFYDGYSSNKDASIVVENSYYLNTITTHLNGFAEAQIGSREVERVYGYQPKDIFPFIEGITKETRAQIIDLILASQPYVKTKVLRPAIEKNEPLQMDSSSYLISLKSAYLDRVERLLNPLTRYEFFQRPEDLPEAKHREFTDAIFDNLKPEMSESIEQFLKGDLSLEQKQYAAIGKELDVGRKKYYDTAHRFTNPQTICDAVPDIEGLCSEVKKAILTVRLAYLSEETTEMIECYLKGQKLLTPAEVSKANSAMMALKKSYISTVSSYADHIQQFRNLIQANFNVMIPGELTSKEMHAYALLLERIKSSINCNTTFHYKQIFKSRIPEIFATDPSMDLKELITKFIDNCNEFLLEVAKEDEPQF